VSARRVVLFVLERPELRAHFNQALLRTPHAAIFCVDGAEGFDRFLEVRPDVCLVCESTSRINGAILCRLIKQHRWSRGVGIYLMSARPDEPSLQALVSGTGIDGVLPLPPPAEQLIEVLARPYQFQLVETSEAELVAEAEAEPVDEKPPQTAPVEVDAGDVFTERRDDERVRLYVRPPQESTRWDAAATSEQQLVELTPAMRKTTEPQVALPTDQWVQPTTLSEAAVEVAAPGPVAMTEVLVAAESPAPVHAPAAPVAIDPAPPLVAQQAPADELTPVATPSPIDGEPTSGMPPVVDETTGTQLDSMRLLSHAAVLSAMGSVASSAVPAPVEVTPLPAAQPPLAPVALPPPPIALAATDDVTPAAARSSVEEPTPVAAAPQPIWEPGEQRRPAVEDGEVFARPALAAERETTIPGITTTPAAVPAGAVEGETSSEYSGIYPLAPDERDSATLRRAIAESQLGGRLTRRVLALYRLLDAVDYYQLLGVSGTADERTVQDAYHALALEYHPDRFFALVPGVIKDRIAALFRRINEAYSVLSRLERRQRYDEQLGQRGAGPPPRLALGEGQAPVAESGTEAQTPVGRKYLRLAFAALARGDLDAAHLNLSFAVGHEPDNALLRRRLDELDRQLQAPR